MTDAAALATGTTGRIGVFGGSFNPPHLGHAMVSLWALSTTGVDEVWWVPTYQHAFGKVSAPFELRLEWCTAAARHLHGVRVTPIEQELGGESRTIDTLEALQARYSGLTFELIIGADLVAEMPRWKRWDALQTFPIHAVGRGDDQVPGELVLPNVSSSALRAALVDGDTELPRAWMDAEVLDRVLASGVFAREHGIDRVE